MVAPLARRTPTDRSHHIHFVEIGAFLGQSSCYMAQLLLRQNQRSKRPITGVRGAVRFHVIDRWGPNDEFMDWADAGMKEAILTAGSAQEAWTGAMLRTGSLPAITQVGWHPRPQSDMAALGRLQSPSRTYRGAPSAGASARLVCPNLAPFQVSRANSLDSHQVNGCSDHRGALRATYLHSPRCEQVNHYPDQSVHFLYLDTTHAYNATLKELHAWWPKIRPGGMLCGDDYCRPGEKVAVDEFFGGLGLTVRNWGKSQFCVGRGTTAKLLATPPRGRTFSCGQ